MPAFNPAASEGGPPHGAPPNVRVAVGIDRGGLQYRFFFFSNEGTESPHIHVQRERRLAKFSLDPVMLISSTEFAAHGLGGLVRIVTEHRDQFLEAWHAFFGR